MRCIATSIEEALLDKSLYKKAKIKVLSNSTDIVPELSSLSLHVRETLGADNLEDCEIDAFEREIKQFATKKDSRVLLALVFNALAEIGIDVNLITEDTEIQNLVLCLELLIIFITLP